jgi:uncharacterized protein
MSSPQVLFRKKQPDLVLISSLRGQLFKPSRYNAHRVAEDGSLILYNSFTGAFSNFPLAHRPGVERFLRADGTYASVDSGLPKYLFERGFIIADGINELQRVRHLHGQQQYRSDVFELILLASEECNFRCTYCYEEFKRGTMENWVREAVVRWLERRVPTVRHLSIEWFGGEPLLGYEAISDIAPVAQKLARQHGVQFHHSMTTNGFLLSRKTFESLLEWGLTSCQVTLDGPEDSHNRTRPLRGGGDTYEVIVSNLRDISATKGEFTISLRVNFDPHNLPYMDRYIANAKLWFGHDRRFKIRFYPVGRWGGANDANLEICGLSANKERQSLELKALGQGLNVHTRIEQMQPNSSICYAARPFSFIVGADGKLMKCTLVLDKKDYNIVGTLLPTGEPKVDLDKIGKWIAPYFEDDASCRKCFFLPACQGIACPVERIENGTRPCPSEKSEIGPTLHNLWAVRSVRAKLAGDSQGGGPCR